MRRKRGDDPLFNILRTSLPGIESLAQIWVRNGAQAVGIWGEQLLLCWPESARDVLVRFGNDLSHLDKVLLAPITINEREVGRVGVVGVEGPQEEARLRAEIDLISQALAMKEKFEFATTELLVQAQARTEMDMAATIQLRLLPQKCPLVSGLDIYAQCYPAAQVGGDFYTFSLDEQRPFVFAVGDVSGKGLPAALFMAMTRIVLHTAARSLITVDPQAIMSRVNEDLYDDFTEVGMFATVFVGCYDQNARHLCYANAGHSPVIYCPSDGEAVMLEADSPAVGVLPRSFCQSYTLPFQVDDTLIMASDGLSECFNVEGEMFGYDRLLATVKKFAHLPPKELSAEIFNTIYQFAEGYDQFDDQTLVVMKGIEK